MHGRIKIKTTAEQQEAKRIEREKKLKIYKAGTLKIFEKRKNNEYGAESLSLTRDFLQQNPDFYTLWNYRKEILLHLKPQKTEDELQALGSDELSLTQCCLKMNPKSYGAWHHRFWALEYMPNPDWTKELKLCDLFFSMDDRNFHCWDYRRLICKHSSVKLQDELDLTINLIKKNFSNYSAFHYRSTLLPVVYPGSGYTLVDEETLLKEYEIVQNAAFTDPNDQSAWFYHRWLLGRGSRNLEILSILVLNERQLVVVFFSCPIEINDKNVLKLLSNDIEENISWKAASDEKVTCTVWYCKTPLAFVIDQQPTEICVEFKNETSNSVLKCSMNGNLSYSYKSNSEAFGSDISIQTKDVLENELESCQQLSELEPGNKWTLFTIVLLMKAIDSQKYKSEISRHLDQLICIDEMREKYYQDLRSKFLIENFIETMPVNASELCLADKKLSSLHHFDHFILMRKVDLTHNDLISVTPLQYLFCVEELILDDNQIKECKGMENLPCLESLSLRNNYINEISDLLALKTCKQLKHLFLCGNPITKDASYENCVKTLLGDLVLDSLS